MLDPHLPAKIDPTSSVDAPEPYLRIIGRPLLVLGFLGGLAIYHARPRTEAPRPERSAPQVVARPNASAEPPSGPPSPPTPAVATPVTPPPPAQAPAPVLDRAAVARAEASLDAASRERAHAEARLADAQRALEVTTLQAAKDLADGKAIASKVRDPSARIAAASTRGGFLKGDRDRLKHELAALEQRPQAKPHALLAKSAVAKPTEGTEYHFEIRRNRVTFIELDRLVDMVKSDARLRLRAGGPRGRLASVVGPVGSFSLKYEMGRSVPEALADLLNSSAVTYNLVGWELVSSSPNRGETYEVTKSSSSTFARAVHRLNPDKDTITMWIYPDGFALYRQLRDDLHAHGFLVAARPLPEGTSIKGSPGGSLSAGQ